MDKINKECVMPYNMDTIIFITIFVIVIPLILLNIPKILKYYMPFLLLLTITLNHAGDGYYFCNLYQIQPTNIASYITKTLINTVVMFAVMTTIISLMTIYKDFNSAIFFGLFAYILIFQISPYLIPRLIDSFATTVENTEPTQHNDLYRYVVGIFSAILIMIIYYIVYKLVKNNLLSLVNIEKPNNLLRELDLN